MRDADRVIEECRERNEQFRRFIEAAAEEFKEAGYPGVAVALVQWLDTISGGTI